MTGDKITPERLVSALGKTPGKRLLLFDLAEEIINKKGLPDIDIAFARLPEVNLAMAEARGYVNGTKKLIEHLKMIPPTFGVTE